MKQIRNTVGGVLALACALLAGPLQGEEETETIQSDWLELVKGYKGSSLGAEMVEVEENGEDDSREITVAIPKSAMRHPDEIEEVVVDVS